MWCKKNHREQTEFAQNKHLDRNWRKTNTFGLNGIEVEMLNNTQPQPPIKVECFNKLNRTALTNRKSRCLHDVYVVGVTRFSEKKNESIVNKSVTVNRTLEHIENLRRKNRYTCAIKKSTATTQPQSNCKPEWNKSIFVYDYKIKAHTYAVLIVYTW